MSIHTVTRWHLIVALGKLLKVTVNVLRVKAGGYMPMMGDKNKAIIETAAEIENVNAALEENEFCYELKKQRVKLLQDLVDFARAELVLSAADLRRYREKCHLCERCSDGKLTSEGC